MPHVYGERRGNDREAAFTMRMTRDEKIALDRQAAELGLTRQQLFELRMLGQAKPIGHYGRPRKQTQAEELPIAG